MAFFSSTFMLQPSNDHDEDDHHQHQTPSSFHQILPPCASPQDFHGMASLLGKRSVPFPGMEGVGGEDLNVAVGVADDELSEDGSPGGEKKRRLNVEQVKTLERNFELRNKLEPERKMQLAKALGLQPRQIAIWFQNRRARWKTKQLEKDYDLLKRQFEAVKADNEALQAQNQKLHAEILALKKREPAESINLNKETDQGSCSNRSENSSDIKLDIVRGFPVIESPVSALQAPSSRQLFPTTIRREAGSGSGAGFVHQLFQATSKQGEQMVKEESNMVTNMFCGIEDHSGFWPWLDQHHFN
ncbi:hypothetical protein MLD38_004302 [Melastoma candidum]|uniref:Uncharacterized protein n=1 Tax=Melastoma candidum TaxID=119954 RepID=A0ACB9S778_9MYRT|nr:hypothetical protein MLD38_004302 [Melastoma candidum]